MKISKGRINTIDRFLQELKLSDFAPNYPIDWNAYNLHDWDIDEDSLVVSALYKLENYDDILLEIELFTVLDGLSFREGLETKRFYYRFHLLGFC